MTVCGWIFVVTCVILIACLAYITISDCNCVEDSAVFGASFLAIMVFGTVAIIGQIGYTTELEESATNPSDGNFKVELTVRNVHGTSVMRVEYADRYIMMTETRHVKWLRPGESFSVRHARLISTETVDADPNI